ncbi:MAG: hypothetical protein JWO80_1723 [Bryobacterales bacterium]|nr:hypothetical protein [Bryobacterales bacterium]
MPRALGRDFLHSLAAHVIDRLDPKRHFGSNLSMQSLVAQNGYRILATNSLEGPLAWGARGRGFKSHQPDQTLSVRQYFGHCRVA